MFARGFLTSQSGTVICLVQMLMGFLLESQRTRESCPALEMSIDHARNAFGGTLVELNVDPAD